MIGHAGNLGVLDKLDGIGAASVLRDLGGGEIDVTVVFEHNVFQHRSVAQRLEDIGLGLRCQVDRLGVAAAFDVEDAGVAPAMFVVADEQPVRIGRQRGLAGAAQTEEQGRAPGLLVGGSGAVHGQARRAWERSSSSP